MTTPNILPPRAVAGSTQEIGGQDVVLAYAGVNAEYDSAAHWRDRGGPQPPRAHAVLR